MKLQKSLILRYTYWLFFPLNKARGHLQFLSLELIQSLFHQCSERSFRTEIRKSRLWLTTSTNYETLDKLLKCPKCLFPIYKVRELNSMISKFTAFHENSSLQITSLSSLSYYALNFDEMHIPSYGAEANL